MRANLKIEVKAAALLTAVAAFAGAAGQVAPLRPWAVLAAESTEVVVCDVVEQGVAVIDPGKQALASVTPDGKPTMPNPEVYILGMVGRARVIEVLKSDGRIKQGDVIRVFTYGRIGLDRPDPLIAKERCVLFLRPVEVKKSEFAGAVTEVFGPLGSAAKRTKFDPKECYTPVQEGFAHIALRTGKTSIVDEIKKALVRGPTE